MFIYIFIYAAACASAFCYSKSKDKISGVVFLLLTFMFLFIPAALRYGIGTDYLNYKRIILNGFQHHKYDAFESGWIPILKLIDCLNLDVHWFFVGTSFLTILFIFLSAEKEDFYLVILCYVPFAYIESYSLVRQSLATVIGMYAIKQWINNKRIKSILFVAIAFSFHKSAAFFFAMLPFINQDWKIFSKQKNAVWFILIFLVFSFGNPAEFIINNIVGKRFIQVISPLNFIVRLK